MKADNELIAEFMGLPLTKQEVKFTGGFKEVPFQRWKYHESWDWLMPVFQSIKRLQDETHFDKRGEELIKTIDKYICLVQIKDAHMYIVEFIKWHNENK